MKGCAEIRPEMDRWLDGEVGSGEREDIARHISGCTECAGIAMNRRALRTRLRSAVEASAGVDTHLRAAVRNQIGSGRGVYTRWPYLAIAAAILVAVGVYGTWRGPGPVMEVGLRQHIHCAINRTYPANGPTPAELAGKLGPEYAGLIPVVSEAVPAGYRVVLAHHCSFKDRKYVHVVARNGANLISLLITARDAGEAFENDLRSVATEDDAGLYSARSQSLSVAGFETPKFLVYLVSNLDEGRNLRMFQAMTPAVKTALS